MKRYIGTKAIPITWSNFGLIFKEQEDGTFICVNDGPSSKTWTKEQIEMDLKAGHLKPYDEL